MAELWRLLQESDVSGRDGHSGVEGCSVIVSGPVFMFRARHRFSLTQGKLVQDVPSDEVPPHTWAARAPCGCCCLLGSSAPTTTTTPGGGRRPVDLRRLVFLPQQLSCRSWVLRVQVPFLPLGWH